MARILAFNRFSSRSVSKISSTDRSPRQTTMKNSASSFILPASRSARAAPSRSQSCGASPASTALANRSSRACFVARFSSRRACRQSNRQKVTRRTRRVWYGVWFALVFFSWSFFLWLRGSQLTGGGGLFSCRFGFPLGFHLNFTVQTLSRFVPRSGRAWF